jgi:hypothetical protein
LADGTERPREDVPGLIIEVVSTTANVAAGGRMRYTGVYESHPEITQGMRILSPAREAGLLINLINFRADKYHRTTRWCLRVTPHLNWFHPYFTT